MPKLTLLIFCAFEAPQKLWLLNNVPSLGGCAKGPHISMQANLPRTTYCTQDEESNVYMHHTITIILAYYDSLVMQDSPRMTRDDSSPSLGLLQSLALHDPPLLLRFCSKPRLSPHSPSLYSRNDRAPHYYKMKTGSSGGDA